jgi:hypothetical protein
MNGVVHAESSLKCVGFGKCEVRGRKPKISPIVELTSLYALPSHARSLRCGPSVEVHRRRTENENESYDSFRPQSTCLSLLLERCPTTAFTVSGDNFNSCSRRRKEDTQGSVAFVAFHQLKAKHTRVLESRTWFHNSRRIVDPLSLPGDISGKAYGSRFCCTDTSVVSP